MTGSPFADPDFQRYLERCNLVAPDPSDEKALGSAASWFVEWKHDPEKIERLLNAIR